MFLRTLALPVVKTFKAAFGSPVFCFGGDDKY